MTHKKTQIKKEKEHILKILIIKKSIKKKINLAQSFFDFGLNYVPCIVFLKVKQNNYLIGVNCIYK